MHTISDMLLKWNFVWGKCKGEPIFKGFNQKQILKIENKKRQNKENKKHQQKTNLGEIIYLKFRNLCEPLIYCKITQGTKIVKDQIETKVYSDKLLTSLFLER